MSQIQRIIKDIIKNNQLKILGRQRSISLYTYQENALSLLDKKVSLAIIRRGVDLAIAEYLNNDNR